MCSLFRKFRDLGNFAKIMGIKMLFLVYYLVQRAKNVKIKGAKIIWWTEIPKLRTVKIKGFSVNCIELVS